MLSLKLYEKKNRSYQNESEKNKPKFDGKYELSLNYIEVSHRHTENIRTIF